MAGLEVDHCIGALPSTQVHSRQEKLLSTHDHWVERDEGAGLGGKVLFGTVVVLDGAIGVASKCTVGGGRPERGEREKEGEVG